VWYSGGIVDRVRISYVDYAASSPLDMCLLHTSWLLGHERQEAHWLAGTILSGMQSLCVPYEGVSVGTRIYVGNLPYATDGAQLTQIFGEYGQVVEARVIMDRNTGQSKGFGFVEMATEGEAGTAINSLNGSVLGDRTLNVNEASERPADGGGRSGGYSNDRPRRDGRSGGYGGDRW
jgi:cold-inducible RNA-binding protein